MPCLQGMRTLLSDITYNSDAILTKMYLSGMILWIAYR